MDSAYDAEAIHLHLRSRARCDHRPSSAWPRRAKGRTGGRAKTPPPAGVSTAEDLRYRERTTVERVNARLKDEFGGRTVRVRAFEVMCHLMFGILALTADQILG